MSTALYRRYRPDSFVQLIGQDHVTVPLRAALKVGKVTHAYLFSGPRGCGKTTSARIFARCLNCAQGPTDSPCGECDSCRELATGGPGSLDVVEIDAASHGGVDDARELRERATFAPVRDRYKIFIIDEAHMVSSQGFNALLKLVEEPPEHVKFVFATTEPDKVLGTIRSRTHHYPFRLVPPDVLEPYLGHLATEEGIDVAPGVLSLVIRAGGGSVRDTLSVLDQLMAGAVDGTLPYAQAVALLGYTDSALLDESVDALAGGDGAAIYRVVERMVDAGHDPRRFVEDLLQRLRDLLIIAVAGEGAGDVLTNVPADQMERMVTQARNWGPRALSRAADLTDHALRSMVGATSPRLQLELLIGRILVPEPQAAAPITGAVGLAGGGAPHEAPAPESATPASSSGRFGAAQAREQLRRQRALSTAEPEAAAASAPATPSVPAGGAHGGDSLPAWPEVTSMPASLQASAVAAAERTASHSEHTASQQATPDQAIAVQASDQDSPQRTQAAQAGEAAWAGEASHGGEAARVPGEQPADPARSAWTGRGDQAGEAVHSAEPVHTAGQQPPATQGSALSSAEADMLRQRWSEVIERLSSISRVAWSMLRENAQLGGVEGGQAVVVLPTQGMVDTFVRGNRAVDVQRAIYESTGLQLVVSAQVGQARGGASVTTPSAAAAHPEQASAPVRPQTSAENGVTAKDPFRAANLDSHDQGQHPDSMPAPGWPPTAEQTPEPQRTPEPEWDPEPEWGSEPGRTLEPGWAPAQQSSPVSTAEPDTSHVVQQPAAEQEVKPVAEPVMSPTPVPSSASVPPSEPVPPTEPVPSPAPVQEPADIAWPEPALPGGPVPTATETSHTAPSTPIWPDPPIPPTSDDAHAQPAPASSSNAPAQPTPEAPAVDPMWGSVPVSTMTWSDSPTSTVTFNVVNGEGADTSATTPQAASPQALNATDGSPEHTRVERRDNHPARRRTHAAGVAEPSTGTHVSAADDDSASIDDDDIDISPLVGLEAIQKILGARVIEERTEESAW